MQTLALLREFEEVWNAALSLTTQAAAVPARQDAPMEVTPLPVGEPELGPMNDCDLDLIIRGLKKASQGAGKSMARELIKRRAQAAVGEGELPPLDVINLIGWWDRCEAYDGTSRHPAGRRYSAATHAGQPPLLIAANANSAKPSPRGMRRGKKLSGF